MVLGEEAVSCPIGFPVHGFKWADRNLRESCGEFLPLCRYFCLVSCKRVLLRMGRVPRWTKLWGNGPACTFNVALAEDSRSINDFVL